MPLILNAKRLSSLTLVAFGVALALGACVRPRLDEVCTAVEPGQLVISEIRGLQSEVDTYGQWVELHNRGTQALQLGGVKLRLRKLNGSGEYWIWVRDPELTIEAGGYLVLGHFPDDELPAHVDYGYNADYDRDLHGAGVLQLYVCGQLQDSVVYRDLPGVGSHSLDGSLIPDVDANDDDANWCADDLDPGPGPEPITTIGVPGTPGERNRPCN